jgi:hypothetical protein
MTNRLSANFNDDTMSMLKTLARKRGTSVTEQVRRAVSLLAWVEALDPRNQVQVVHRDRASVPHYQAKEPSSGCPRSACGTEPTRGPTGSCIPTSLPTRWRSGSDCPASADVWPTPYLVSLNAGARHTPMTRSFARSTRPSRCSRRAPTYRSTVRSGVGARRTTNPTGCRSSDYLAVLHQLWSRPSPRPDGSAVRPARNAFALARHLRAADPGTTL